MSAMIPIVAVSYTHLDVYKRQVLSHPSRSKCKGTDFLIKVCWGNHKILIHIDLLKEIDRESARVFGKKIKKVCTYK